jgi:hypothetical protein
MRSPSNVCLCFRADLDSASYCFEIALEFVSERSFSPLRVVSKAPAIHCVFQAVFTSALIRCVENIRGTCSPSVIHLETLKNIRRTIGEHVPQLFPKCSTLGKQLGNMFSTCFTNVLQMFFSVLLSCRSYFPLVSASRTPALPCTSRVTLRLPAVTLQLSKSFPMLSF